MEKLDNIFKKVEEMRDAVAKEVKARVKAQLERRDDAKAADEYVFNLEQLASDWQVALSNGKLAELQKFLVKYRALMVEAMIDSSDIEKDKEMKARIKVFDMLINEPQRAIKEYEDLRKSRRM